MTTSTTFDAITGGLGHLRIHSPARPCPFEKSAKKRTAKLEKLLLSFEQATGWQMGYQETADSRQARQQASDPEFPIAGQFSIDDLSQLLPPGVPASSRIYCEKLVEQLNHVVAELDSCRGDLYRLQKSNKPSGPTSVASPKASKRFRNQISDSAGPLSEPPPSSTLPPANLPLTSHSVNIVPLCQAASNAVFEWHVEPTGLTRFAVITCDRNSSSHASELIAARATFLTECRHRTCDESIQFELQSVCDGLFPGDACVNALCGSVDSLTGDLTLAGCRSFLVTSTGHVDGLSEVPDATLLRSYLPHGQHLLVSSNPSIDSSQKEVVAGWWKSTIKKLRSLEPSNLASLFEHQIANAVPSLPSKPEIALSITRV